MEKVRILFIYMFMLLLAGQLKGQSSVLVLTNKNCNKEYTITCHDKIKLDIKNKRGKLKEKEEVVVLSIGKENLYVLPDKKRFGEQAVIIDEIKHIWIKTPGTRATGCFLFALNIFSRTSNTPVVYKKIDLDKPKWSIKVVDNY
jgi:hypothetical protein